MKVVDVMEIIDDVHKCIERLDEIAERNGDHTLRGIADDIEIHLDDYIDLLKKMEVK